MKLQKTILPIELYRATPALMINPMDLAVT